MSPIQPTSLSMLSVQWHLILANKAKYGKLFIGSSLTWLLVFLGVINTMREFVINDRLHGIIVQLCETFSDIDNLMLLWLAALTAAIVIYWPKVRASFTLPDNTRIIVECCDLFRQHGLKVIQSTETFDTVIGGVIKPHSVNGTFLQHCADVGFDIDAAIARELHEDKGVKGRHRKVPIGTVCPLTVSGEPYCIIAFTHWDEDGRNISLTETEYMDFLRVMWDNLGMPCVKNDTVNVAVLGNANLKQTRMYTTEQRIADMIGTFVATDKGCCRTLHICVHTGNAQEIDFVNFSSIIRFLYNSEELRREIAKAR